MPTTTHCVICLQKATGASGHVHKGTEIITAGLCDEHLKGGKEILRFLQMSNRVSVGCKGCYGPWSKEMGNDNFQSGVMYIDSYGMHPAGSELKNLPPPIDIKKSIKSTRRRK